jgi:uncharacterized cupredoxin-like copper-binding protein
MERRNRVRRSAYLALTFGLLFAMLGLAAAVTSAAAQQGTATPGAGIPACPQPANATPLATPDIHAIQTVVANQRATAEATKGDEDEDEKEDKQEDEAQETAAAATASVTPVCSVTITMVDIDYNPNEFTIPADQPVLLIFQNMGKAEHDFSVQKLGIDVDADPGETETLIVNAPAGDYDFYCDEDAHAAAGMVGIMHVTKQ